MSVNVQSALNRIFQEFDTTLLASFNQSPKIWSQYAMEVPSSSRSTLHAWLGNQSVVREWFGSRKANSFGTRNWEVVNRSWELSYSFDRDQIRDDLEGLVAAAVVEARNQGFKWARHEDLLVAATLEAGPTSLCYDGQDFFSTSHPVDVDGITSGTFSNLNTSSALTHANFSTALTQMFKYKLEDGSPMLPPGTEFTLMVPPALRTKAMQIVEDAWLSPSGAYGVIAASSPSVNTMKGQAKMLVNAWLTSDTTWYLLADNYGTKPLMFQRRQGVELQELGPGSQEYYDKKKIQIGGDARYACSYTFPQLAIQNTA